MLENYLIPYPKNDHLMHIDPKLYIKCPCRRSCKLKAKTKKLDLNLPKQK